MWTQLRAIQLSVVSVCSVLALGAPASAQVAVTSPILTERAAVAGETYQGTIKLKNMAADTHRVRLYQTDYQFSADGSNAFDAPGTTPRSNARWISLSTNELLVAGKSETTINYTVTVPAGGPLSGSYWSMIMVEQEPKATQAPENAAPAMVLTPTVRYGIQVATHMSSTAAPSVVFTTPVIDGTTISFDIANSGERAVRPNLRIELYRADGTLVTASDAQRGLLYPTTSVRQTFNLASELPAGKYTAVVLADIGLAQLVGSRFSIVR